MAEQLTLDIWTLILRHVSQSDRLGSCSLVSQKLRAAAAAATDALEVELTQGQEEEEEQQQQQQRAKAFQGFLQQHGSQLTSLKLEQTPFQDLLQLPCSRLLCFELTRGVVQLGPHNGLPGVLASCSGLTGLDLSDCRVPTGLSGLSVLVNLRDLQLRGMFLTDHPWKTATLPGTVLSCMLHLTCLQLSDVFVEDVHHLSCLCSLAVLSTRCEGSVRLAPDIAPGFALPASLRDLSLIGLVVQLGPAVLSAAVQLTRLELSLLTVVAESDMSSGAALLAAVSGLHKLDTLELESLRLAWPQPSAAYQALTASSSLQRLSVSYCSLPAGAWEHVFPPARVCGELQWLELTDDIIMITARVVSALVGCCPCLQDLILTVRSAAAVAALTPLTCLTCLSMYAHGCDETDVPDFVQGVAALTRLCDVRLCLYDNDYNSLIGRTALLPLTALTQLTRCDIHPCRLANQADPEPPDVWQQLQQFCLEDDTDSADATDGTSSDGTGSDG